MLGERLPKRNHAGRNSRKMNAVRLSVNANSENNSWRRRYFGRVIFLILITVTEVKRRLMIFFPQQQAEEERRRADVQQMDEARRVERAAALAVANAPKPVPSHRVQG